MEWDRLLIQAEITLNLLRNSRVNPHLSSWAYIQKPYDFNKMPMAPPGTKIVAHSKPQKRASWAYHGQSGWYIGPAPEHYRCVKCYMPTTYREIVTDIIKFIPTNIPIPEVSIDDHIRNTLEELTTLLKNKVTTHPPILLSPTSRQGIIQLAQIFRRDKHDTEDATSEGASKERPIKNVPTTKHKKMSDEEFETLIRSIKHKKTGKQTNPSQTSKSFASPTPVLTYQNIPLPKASLSNSFPYITDKVNHIFESGQKQSLDQLLQGNDKLI